MQKPKKIVMKYIIMIGVVLTLFACQKEKIKCSGSKGSAGIRFKIYAYRRYSFDYLGPSCR